MELIEEILHRENIQYLRDEHAIRIGGIALQYIELTPSVYNIRQTFDLYKRDGVHLYTLTNNVSAIKLRGFIRSKLGLLPRLHARKCRVTTVSPDVYSKFLARHHIQGSTQSTWRYGLTYDGNLVAVMGFVRVIDKTILNRFCLGDFAVVGSASKLLSHALAELQSPIETFSSNAYSNGRVYESIGFRYIGENKTDLWYISPDGKLLNRRQFQKKMLSKKLQRYNPTLTERENMIMNGYGVYNNSGTIKWVYE